MDRVQSVQHHGLFIGVRLALLVGQRLGMRAVMNAALMQRGIAWLDLAFAEEIAVVIEKELVVIRVSVEKLGR